LVAVFVLAVLGIKKYRSRKTPTTEGLKEPLAKTGLASVQEGAPAVSLFKQFADIFCNLFAVWLTIAALAAVLAPWTFTWIPNSSFTGLLGLLMLSVGITTSVEDFKNCLKQPVVPAINFVTCYGIMPALAYLIGMLMGAEGPILAGLVLVGCTNGGQASNLCALIAGGDVALSVLMTTCTTLGCIVMTPLICKMVLGAVVPVSAVGIVISTFQVVVAPIFIGVVCNKFVPNICKGVSPYTPVVGVTCTVLLVGASVAQVAPTIISSGIPLQIACLALHVIGGILGYIAMTVLNFDEKTRRTVAIETAMKSSAFGFVLASQDFGAFDVRVPPAVSVVWMSITGSVMAVYWKFKPLPSVEASSKIKWEPPPIHLGCDAAHVDANIQGA
jgi:BASS family bile acid:Na+ symporter